MKIRSDIKKGIKTVIIYTKCKRLNESLSKKSNNIAKRSKYLLPFALKRLRSYVKGKQTL